MDHPYIEGFYPACPKDYDEEAIEYGAAKLKCGVITKTFKYNETNRNRAPLTLMGPVSVNSGYYIYLLQFQVCKYVHVLSKHKYFSGDFRKNRG